MAKLYPPVIENIIPACYEENGMIKFIIPFSMNRAISPTQVGGFELKIKTVQSGKYLETLRTGNDANYKITENESYVIFYLKDTDKRFKVGQFYKVQLAYLMVDIQNKNKWYNQYLSGKITLQQYEEKIFDKSEVGYYSSVGILKYTTKPKVYISQLNQNSLNSHLYTYIGYYEQTDGDISEKVYSYRFNLYSSDGITILKTSEEQLHNSLNDTNMNLSQDIFSINTDLVDNKTYYIQYIITTTNKIVVSSPKYRITQRQTIDPELDAEMSAVNNFDQGVVEIFLNTKPDYYVQRAIELCKKLNDNSWLTEINSEIMEKNFSSFQAGVLKANSKTLNKIIDFYTLPKNTGSFIVSRADEDSNYTNWEQMYKFNLVQQSVQGLLYKDYTVEQGKKYRYSIQQYNDKGVYSKRIYSNIIVADFEDMFLFDGEKQLKVRFNPKVSKYSRTIPESKQETIGNKYPFIFRNGQVNYHEFSISGLISYFMDNNSMFSEIYDNMFKSDALTINYTTDNILSERLFKNQVLEWLNDGNPKLFRTPEEGNFIIKIMKVSLSPEDKLGRLLHTFSCSACEIADCTNENLLLLNILKLDDSIITEKMQFFSVDLSTKSPNEILNNRKGEIIHFSSLKCEGLFYGDELLITYEDNTQDSIVIGITENYEINNVPLIKNIIILPRYSRVNKANMEDFLNYYILNSDGRYEKVQAGIIYNENQVFYEISNKKLRGLMTFGFKSKWDNLFSSIDSISYPNPTHRQFIGEHDILKEIQYIKDDKGEYIENIKELLVNWNYIRVTKRPVDRIVKDDAISEYYYAIDNDSEKLILDEFHPSPYILHQIGKGWIYAPPGTVYNEAHPNYIFDQGSPESYIDFYNKKEYNEYEPWIEINGERIYVDDTLVFSIKDLQNFNIISLLSGNGVIIDIGYQTQKMNYKLEYGDLEDVRQDYDMAIEEINNLSNGNYNNVKTKYIILIKNLISALNSE